MKLDTLRPRLGKTFLDRLTSDVVLTVGTKTYSRDALVRELKVGNFAAARKLGKALDDLGITNPADLAHLAPEDLARIRGVGETTVYVLLCLQDNLKQGLLAFDHTWATYAKHARKPQQAKHESARKRMIRRRVERALAQTQSTGDSLKGRNT
jgi:hypothetical protein